MKKIIIIIGCLLIFTGCTVNYNVVIKNNGVVIENSNIKVKKLDSKDNFSSLKKDLISEYNIILNKRRYNYEIKNVDNNVMFNINKKGNINQLFENSLYNILYEDYELYSRNKIMHFKSVGDVYIGNLFVTKNYEEGFSFSKEVDTLKINITFEGKVIDSNADEVDKKNNTYTWIFTKDNYKKGIKFSYDKSVKVLNINEEVSNNKENNSIKRVIEILTSLGIIIFFAILFINQKNKRINRL